MSRPLLEIHEISKSFPGLKALDRVSMEVRGGEILAVVGQNGSGKSTLVKVLAGVYEPDPGGRITTAGGQDGAEPAELHFIHQDLALIGSLSTVENLDLGRALRRRDCLPAPVAREHERARQLLSDFGADIDIDAPIIKLTAAERTIVAIARALDGWQRADNVLILDEPTAALHGQEVDKLFAAVRRAAERGAGVIFISHRLDEVIMLADDVIALRDGQVVARARRGEFDHDELVRMIAGRDVAARSASDATRGEPVLSASRITGARLRGLDLTVHRGEILGIAGILGSGREELAGVLFGARPRLDGTVLVEGRSIPGSAPRAAIAAGMAYVPADRRGQGAVMTMSARENLTLPRLRDLRRTTGSLDTRAERRQAAEWAQRVGLRPPNPEQPLGLFSGGNQQKYVLAKWLRNEPRLLLLDEPTQGVDVGAKDGIYDLIADAARAGAGILLASSDTKELAAISHRVLVLRDGECVAELDRTSITEARIIRESLGVSGEALTGASADLREESHG
jgi:ABC-type sugar transport system ATPase subunit